VALIEGACVGGGLELAICCDLRVAAASARFGVPIQRLGVTMAWPEIEALVGLVGRGAALEILLEGRVFPAAEAQQKGLVTRVVPDDRVEAEAYECARRIAAGAPLVHRWHKQAAARLQPRPPLSDAERDEAYATFDSEDFREGVQAFLAKRPPVFRGR
jgi:enoyl-CoA hydratase/carnithine racemase